MPIVRNPHNGWAGIRQHLEEERLRIQLEIASYPAPIPACDACFNHLLEQRALLCAELERMEQAAAESATSIDPADALTRFVASSRYLRFDI